MPCFLTLVVRRSTNILLLIDAMHEGPLSQIIIIIMVLYSLLKCTSCFRRIFAVPEEDEFLKAREGASEDRMVN